MKLLLKSLGFLILFIGSIIAILLLIPDQQYKRLAEKGIHQYTDRDVSIGELTIQRTLNPSFQFKDVSLSNPDWADKSDFIKMGQFSFSISLPELIKGRLTTGLSSKATTIHLAKNTQGLTNWQFTANDSAADIQQARGAELLETLARFVLKHLDMDDFKLVFDDEQANAHYALAINKLNVVESDGEATQSLDLAGVWNGMPFSINGSTGTLGALGVTKNLPLDLKASFDNADFLIKGALNADAQALNLESDIQLSLPNLKIISQLTGQDLPTEWQNISGSTRLLLNSGQISLQEIKLTMDSDLTIDLNGSVTDLNTLGGVNIDLTATLASVQGLSTFTRDPLPDVGPVTFSGKINSNNETLLLEAANLTYVGEYGNTQITGYIGDLRQLDKLNLKAELSLPDLSVMQLFSSAKIPRVGKIKLTSDLISNGPADISANNVIIKYNHNGLELHSSGSINSIIKKGGELNLEIDATLDSLHALKAYVKTELPAIGPLKLQSKLSGTLADLHINELDLELKDRHLTGNITGDIGAVTALHNITLNANLASPSLGGLLTKLGLDNTATTTPVKLSADVTKTQDGLKMRDFVLEMESNKIRGDIEFTNLSPDTARPKLRGEIEVVNLNLTDILNSNLNSDEKAGDLAEPKTGMNLPDTPLPFKYIRENDLDLTINVGQFETSFITLSDAIIKAESTGGQFKLGPINTQLNGGDTHLEVTLDATAHPAQTLIKGDIDGFSFKQAGTFEGSTLLENEGTAKANLELTGTGESVASIFGSSSGSGNIYIENLTIKNDTLKVISSDLVSELVGSLNLSQEKNETTRINCSAVKVDMQQGVLTTPNGYIADAEKFTITGDAKVNFKDQAIDVKFYTHPKKGLGLDLGKLASAIQVKGTLTQPKVGINPGGVAELGATIGVALATGGISLLAQGQYEKLKARSELCSKVIE